MGEVRVDITSEPILVEQAMTLVQGDPACGAIAVFVGTTRSERHPDHGSLVRLDYEAYDAMALSQMRALVERANERWSPARVALVHRIGSVPPGEASVLVAVACGHRSEAFESCRWLIDTLKRDVPIWKKEVFEAGHERWIEPGCVEP